MIERILIMVVCVLLSAYFSATETAFSSANKTRLKSMAEKGNKKAKLAFRLSEDYDHLISTILIGNNIVNIALASIGTLVFVAVWGDAGATISTIVITIVVLIFGEITPKSVAKDIPEQFAMFSAPFINLLMILMTPLTFLFGKWKLLVSRLFKSNQDTKMSQDELLLLLNEVQQEGTIDESEGELLKNAVTFGDMEAQDILTHRVDLEAVSEDATFEEIANKFTQTQFSRLLVYRENIDQIIGVIHQKDFYVGTGITHASLKDIMTLPVYVHPAKKLDSLLQLMRSRKSHVAVIIDEYGGTLGIVTMEDILEELVGEIWDEHDEVEEPFRKLDENTYLIDCSVPMTTFCEHFNIEDTSESSSVGGWVMEQLTKIPSQGDYFDYQHLTVTVTSTDDLRVEQVKVIIHPELLPKEEV